MNIVILYFLTSKGKARQHNSKVSEIILATVYSSVG